MTGKTFSIHIRTTPKKIPIYYAQFKLSDGTWSNAKSSGIIDNGTKKSKANAEAWASREAVRIAEERKQAEIDAIHEDQKRKIFEQEELIKQKNISFSQYSEGFFDWHGSWATNKKIEGRRISERHCKDRQDLMRIHILPVLGNFLLTEIDKIRIMNFRNDLFQKGYSSSIINKCIYTIKAILEDAEDQGLISSLPKFKKAADKSRQKGILSIDEVNQIFSFEWMTKPSYSHPSKPQFMGYVGNLLAASTALRISELQGIQIHNLHLNNGYITIKKSWDNRLNRLNETTKTGRERNIFIPVKVVRAIEKLLETHTSPDNPDSFLFYGNKKPEEKPAEKVVFIRSLYIAMEKIGIGIEERKRRNITFHSWRYFFNSLLINSKIPLTKVQSMTGHITNEMSQHYYHLDDMADVRAIQEKIFAN